MRAAKNWELGGCVTWKVSSTSGSGGPEAMAGGRAGGLFRSVMTARPSFGVFSLDTFLEEARRLL